MAWQNKVFHYCGAFTFTVMGLRWVPLDDIAIVSLVAAGCILVEAYQWTFQPNYVGKELDTLVDLLADTVGIVLALI